MRAIATAMRTVLTVSVVVLAAASSASAQLNPPPGKTAEQVYKNIQVLQGTPAELLLPQMRLFAGALGGDCEFCHVNGDQSKDDKVTKRMARQMITMVMNLNKTSFGGAQMVTCYTCHRGSSQPVTVPFLPTVEKSPEELEQKPTLPAVDEVFAKYIQALGGEQAIRKVTSRSITGTQTIPTGGGGRIPMEAQLERYVKAPGLLANFYRTDKLAISDGFDGMASWSQDARGNVATTTSFDEMRAKRNADLYMPLDLKQQYSGTSVVAMEKVNDHDAYVVQAALPNSRVTERLYFDTQSGLLLRILTLQPTPLGNFPSEVDYDDYRDTNSGVKIPFLITTDPSLTSSALASKSVLRVEKVQDNVAIDDSKFTRPQPKTAPR